MNTRNSSKSGLFLMELLMGILFFSITASICVKLFVTSHQLSSDSVSLNHAVTMAQSIAETFYGCNGDEETLARLLPAENHGLQADVTLSKESELICCHILIFDDDADPSDNSSCIYQLNVSLFPKEEPSHE